MYNYKVTNENEQNPDHNVSEQKYVPVTYMIMWTSKEATSRKINT